QSEKAIATADLNHMHDTIAALRDEMDEMKLHQNEEIQGQNLTYRDNVEELMSTISALRDQLDKEMVDA
ncbi:MAG: hypothetical protein ACI9V8_001639, partial [Urechidicola sp.]